MNVRLLAGSDLPPLGWQHATPLDLSRVEPLRNDLMKPKGGLWTSPIRADDDGWVRSDWTRWCESEQFGTPSAPVTRIIPDPSARVAVVDTHADLLALESSYRDTNPVLHAGMWPLVNWVKMAQDIDAVWLTEAGQWATRFTTPGLYGWDCETVFWLNPRFTVGERVEPAELSVADCRR